MLIVYDLTYSIELIQEVTIPSMCPHHHEMMLTQRGLDVELKCAPSGLVLPEPLFHS